MAKIKIKIMSKRIDVRQKLMAKNVYGVELKNDTTNRKAVKVLNKKCEFKNQTVWSNKI